jgi:hypothetical protein
LKTLINITTGKKEKIGPKSKTPGEPSPDLVWIAYGQRKFGPNAGFYNSAEVGETINFEDKVSFMPYFDSNTEHVLGGTFYFRGLRFMLYLDEHGFTGNVNLVNKNSGQTAQYSKPVRHLKQVRVTLGQKRKYLSHVINFKWGETR